MRRDTIPLQRDLGGQGATVTLSSHQAFSYGVLPEGAYIRHLLLDPGLEHDPLVCQLVVTHIDTVPDFEALSYT